MRLLGVAVIEGAANLKANAGGRGLLISGVPGTSPADVVVVGGGVVGVNAAKMAVGLGARVTVLDRSVPRLRYLSDIFGNGITRYSSGPFSKRSAQCRYGHRRGADTRGDAPKLVSRPFCRMKLGSVLVDVAIDQGGCFETSKATTHDDPTYIVDNVVVCVANMRVGAADPIEALNNATLPHVLALADRGLSALDQHPHLMNGLNVRDGITYQAVIDALGERQVDTITGQIDKMPRG